MSGTKVQAVTLRDERAAEGAGLSGLVPGAGSLPRVGTPSVSSG